MNKINQRGFAAAESLLIAIIVLLVGFIGYYVWHTQKQSNQTLDRANKSTQASKASQIKPVTYFTIKEWGVRAPYNGHLALEYSVGTNSKSHYMQLSSTELDARDPSCKESPTYGGTITRYKADENVLYADDTDSGKTAEQTVKEQPPTVPYSHVGGYYYFYSSPQGVCASPEKDDGSTQQATQNAFKDITAHLQAIK